MSERIPTYSKIYCNLCKRETNHELKCEHSTVHTMGGLDDSLERSTYRLWICMGCEAGTLEWMYQNDHTADDGWEIDYYPERSQNRLVPKSYSKLKPTLKAIYYEAISCYNGNSLILCAAGLRALLEGICQNKKIRGRNLKEKIDGLQPLLPNRNIIKNLHHFRFMGNDAVHELEAPKPIELSLAIGVIEDLLNFFYELDYKTSLLRQVRRAYKRKPRGTPTATTVGSVTPTTPAPTTVGSVTTTTKTP